MDESEGTYGDRFQEGSELHHASKSHLALRVIIIAVFVVSAASLGVYIFTVGSPPPNPNTISNETCPECVTNATSTTIEALPVPADVKANLNADHQVELSWGGVAQATGYNIYRSDGTGQYSLLASISTTDPLSDTSYRDDSVVSNTVYTYLVTMTRDSLESNFPQPVIVKIPDLTNFVPPASSNGGGSGGGGGSSPPPETDNMPSIDSISYSPASLNSSQTITFTAVASDDNGLTSIQIFIDNTSIGSCTVSSTTATCSKPAGPYTAGNTHTLYVTATDSASQTAKSSTSTFTIQQISSVDSAPSISSVSYSPINPNSSQTIAFTVVASDDINIKNVQIFVDGNSIGTCFGGNSITCTRNGGPYSAGSSHTFYAIVTDNSSQTAQSSTINFAIQSVSAPVDNPPTVSVTYSPSSPNSSQIITFTATATDDKKLSTIQIFLDGSSIGSCPVSGTSATCTKTNGPYASSSTHTLYATATDNSSQLKQSSSTTFTIAAAVVDNPPSISVTNSPTSPNSSQTVTYTATATDDKGLTSIQIFVDGSSIGTCSVSGLSATCAKTGGPYSNGSNHTYYASVTDTKPQTIQSVTSSFTVSSTKRYFLNIFYPTPSTSFKQMINSRYDNKDYASSYDATVLNFYPNLIKSDYAQSIPEIQNKITVAKQKGFAYVCYDNEAANGDLSTPPSELTDPVGYTNQAGQLVKAAGLKYNIQPTWENLQAEYAHIDWSKVDLLTMQLQRFPLGNTPQKTFHDLAISASAAARAGNPNIIVIAQVNLAFDNTPNKQATLDFINSIKDSIDGVSLVINPGDPEAPVSPFLTAIGR